MNATDFLALAESDPEKANGHIALLRKWQDEGDTWKRWGEGPYGVMGWDDILGAYHTTNGPPPYATGNAGTLFFEMWDALPREGSHWHYSLIELMPSCPPGTSETFKRAHLYTVDGCCHAAGVNFDVRGRPHGPTRNLAVAAALSEAMHEEKDDA